VPVLFGARFYKLVSTERELREALANFVRAIAASTRAINHKPQHAKSAAEAALLK
jgi:hypothetical protein